MRAPQASGAPSPQGPRNEGDIQMSAGWQAGMYATSGVLGGGRFDLQRALGQSSAQSGGQQTGHPPTTDEGAFNTHTVHGDQSLGSDSGVGAQPSTVPPAPVADDTSEWPLGAAHGGY